MKRYWTILTATLFVTTLSPGCGGDMPGTDSPATVDHLAETIGEISRISEVSLYVGDSLWEYINGGAEIYHQYGFVEVATATYKVGQSEVTADIYLFDSPAHAFGLLTTTMPPEPDLTRLGALGFSSDASLDFIKGPHLVRLTGYDASEQTRAAIQAVGSSLAETVPGDVRLPDVLDAFPDSGRATLSEKLLARSYLGQAFLTEVFTADYTLDGNDFTLFITDDTSGEKFLQWSETVGDRAGVAEGLPYDDGRSFKVDNGYYGEIVAGLKGGRLMGVVGYTGRLQQFISAWLDSQT